MHWEPLGTNVHVQQSWFRVMCCCKIEKIPTVMKAAGMMLPCIHITLLAGCKQLNTGGAVRLQGRCPTLINTCWTLRGFYQLYTSRTNFQTLARWRRGRREKKLRNWMSSIRPSCLNYWEKTTTSTALTARQKVSLTELGVNLHVRNVCVKRWNNVGTWQLTGC